MYNPFANEEAEEEPKQRFSFYSNPLAAYTQAAAQQAAAGPMRQAMPVAHRPQLGGGGGGMAASHRPVLPSPPVGPPPGSLPMPSFRGPPGPAPPRGSMPPHPQGGLIPGPRPPPFPPPPAAAPGQLFDRGMPPQHHHHHHQQQQQQQQHDHSQMGMYPAAGGGRGGRGGRFGGRGDGGSPRHNGGRGRGPKAPRTGPYEQQGGGEGPGAGARHYRDDFSRNPWSDLERQLGLPPGW